MTAGMHGRRLLGNLDEQMGLRSVSDRCQISTKSQATSASARATVARASGSQRSSSERKASSPCSANA